jgi:prevent-host-death family protein
VTAPVIYYEVGADAVEAIRPRVPVRQDAITAASFRGDMADWLDRVRFLNWRLVLTRRGRPLAAVISLEDLARLRALEKTDVH